jgi:hypothetical protein
MKIRAIVLQNSRMKASRLLLPLCLAAIGLCAAAHPAHAADALKNLARIDAFAFGGIGAAGTPSEGEIEFREILARPTAARDFLKLLDSGNRQAKCYALVAIRKLDPKSFPALAAPSLEDDRAKVKTISGCVIMELPIGSVVAGIAKGNYDLYLDRKLHP